ncbi:MAG: hypothetical protein AAGF46_08885, partial [Pseudomonadota bacterium]
MSSTAAATLLIVIAGCGGSGGGGAPPSLPSPVTVNAAPDARAGIDQVARLNSTVTLFGGA